MVKADSRTIWISLLVLTASLLIHGCAADQIRRDLSGSERLADLEYLARAFPVREQSFTPATQALFDARLATLNARIAAISHDEFLMGIQWAVASADNGHSEVLTHEHQQLRLPVDLHWFEDGLYVVAVRPGYEDLLAARVLSIEGATPQELLAALDSYSPGNDAHARILSGYFLERPELLAAIGRAPSSDALTLTFELPSGPSVARRLPGLAGESASRAADSRHLVDRIDPLPLYLQESEKAARLTWLPEINAAYVRISRNSDKTLPAMLDRILMDIEVRRPHNVIVDLRLNGGGNYELTAPFAVALPARVPEQGKLVLILGNETFSAGIITAAILKARADARTLIVGEAAGDDLQFWSEGGFLTLPNSGLRIYYSDGYHDWRNGYRADDPRYRANPRNARMNNRFSAAAGSLEPDIRVPLTFADYAAGHDPVMSAIRTLLASPETAAR